MFRVLFESAPGLYLVLDPQLRIVAATDAYLEATMTRRAQVLGRGIFEVFPDNPDDPGASGERNLRASLDRVLAEGRPDAMAVQKYDVRRPLEEGGEYEERFWSPVNAPVLDEDGSVACIIHRVEDVTEYVREREHTRREHQRITDRMENEIVARSLQLQEANERLRDSAHELAQANASLELRAQQLRQADELKSQFLAMASHELRTPLTAIEGFTSTMLQRWEQLGDADKLQFLEIIDAQGHRLSRLVEDLLTLSKVESGKLRVEPELLDVAIAVKQVVAALGVDGDVEVSAPPAATVVADAGHVEQILVNLITNARKYGRPPIAVEVRPDAQWVDICVADRGDGVPPAFVPHLFETFSRARHARSGPEGTGLGLAITRALAEAQGGRAWYEPGAPRGARFLARLPGPRPAHD